MVQMLMFVYHLMLLWILWPGRTLPHSWTDLLGSVSLLLNNSFFFSSDIVAIVTIGLKHLQVQEMHQVCHVRVQSIDRLTFEGENFLTSFVVLAIHEIWENATPSYD